jgi:hypothetical protein
MHSGRKAIPVAIVIVLLSCNSGPTNYFVSEVHVGRDGELSPVGPRSLFEPSSGTYYFFFHGATLTSVEHMEKNSGDAQAHQLLFLETRIDGKLDRTVKSDLLLVGDFGTVSAEKTCFYNRPVQSNYSSVRIGFSSDGYSSHFEQPAELAGAPKLLPPLTSVSLVRIIRNEADYALVSADYEFTGELRGLQVASASGGKISPGTHSLSYQIDSKDPRLDKYGMPFRLGISGYLSSHRLQLPSVTGHEEST